MKNVDIIVLTNNIVLPFQQINVNFLELNKLFASKLLAEHGLGFLINVYDDSSEEKLINKLIFDTGGPNLTYLHNLDVFNYPVYDVNAIILSHWHYDHTGSLIKLLERINREITVYTHESAKFERLFRRSKELRSSDLEGKTREEIIPLLSSSSIVGQEPILRDKIEKLGGSIVFLKESYEIFRNKKLRIIISGEIPRNRKEEDFSNFFSIQEGISKIDRVLDDKCLIFEFEDHSILLNGCCHSGLMNTLDYVKTITDKPISHIIGGIHMARATDQRVLNTLDYIEALDKYKNELFIFPIHCSGEKFRKLAKNYESAGIKTYDVSVGTKFKF